MRFDTIQLTLIVKTIDRKWAAIIGEWSRDLVSKGDDELFAEMNEF